jgi:hypothetical protein
MARRLGNCVLEILEGTETRPAVVATAIALSGLPEISGSAAIRPLA